MKGAVFQAGTQGKTMRGLEGRTAIVTGAGQGVGRGITERLLAERANVLPVDKNPDTLETRGRSHWERQPS